MMRNKQKAMNKGLSLMLTVLMMLTLLPMSAMADTPCTGCTAAGTFTQGDGSAGDPWQVSTVAQLDHIREHRDKHFKLMNDIDLTDYLASGGGGYIQWSTAGWMPIGDNSGGLATYFTGTFNGDGHKITGLTIDRPSENFIGLFGRTNGSTIQNLGVEIAGSGSVRGEESVGALVGFNEGSIINCYATGMVNGNSYIGGFAGQNGGGGTLSNCYATGTVTGTSPGNQIGGLTGYNNLGASISNCYATGAVSGNELVGGLAGFNYGSITYSYATGAVNGNTYVGGLVGESNDYNGVAFPH